MNQLQFRHSRPITRIIGKDAPPMGIAPAVVLINPKFGRNVSMALRVCACFGFPQLWFTGNRISLDSKKGKRLPREERMKQFAPVDLIQCDYPFDAFPRGTTPVAVEIMEHSEALHNFEHPENAVYVFGPEDGGLDRTTKSLCHHFVTIPSRHCFNLAVAVSLVLYDRTFKAWLGNNVKWPELAEHRGFICNDDEGNLL